MSTDKQVQIIDKIKQYVRDALLAANAAAHYISEHVDSDDDLYSLRKESAAVNAAQHGLYSLQKAEVLYLTFFDEGDDKQLEEIFHQFHVFAREIETSYATNHSHQWTYIERDRLMKKADGTPYAVPDVWQDSGGEDDE